MKKFFILSIAATLTCSISFARIWRVNNNHCVMANFATAQTHVTILAGVLNICTVTSADAIVACL